MSVLTRAARRNIPEDVILQSEYWLNQPATSSRFAVLQEESEGHQRTSHSSTPIPPPVYVTGAQNISPILQLLEQMAKEQCEIEALAYNQVKIHPKTTECYGAIV
jgi:hypothetical protein